VLLARQGEIDRRACFSVLSAVKGDVRITRTGTSTLVIEPTSGSMLRSPYEALYRAPDIGFRVNDEVVTCDGVVRVLVVDDLGRPTRIEFVAPRSLDDPDIRLLVWRDGALTPFALPIGATELVPWTPGPTRLF
jgi:hypothetical protein